MKHITFITLLVFILISCTSKNEKDGWLTVAANAAPVSQKDCLASYKTVAGERINQMYGSDIKDGHWIHYELVNPNKKQAKDSKVVRAKIEEGYYKENKREGFWKFYSNDGTLKDSVEYKNDVPVLN